MGSQWLSFMTRDICRCSGATGKAWLLKCEGFPHLLIPTSQAAPPSLTSDSDTSRGVRHVTVTPGPNIFLYFTRALSPFPSRRCFQTGPPPPCANAAVQSADVVHRWRSTISPRHSSARRSILLAEDGHNILTLDSTASVPLLGRTQHFGIPSPSLEYDQSSGPPLLLRDEDEGTR